MRSSRNEEGEKGVVVSSFGPSNRIIDQRIGHCVSLLNGLNRPFQPVGTAFDPERMVQLYGGLDHTAGQRSPDSETPQWNLGGKLFSEIRHKRNGIQMERQGEAHQDERNSKNSRKSRKQVVASEVG